MLLRGEFDADLTEYRWILDIYLAAGNVLTEEERNIYFSAELQGIDTRIRQEYEKLNERYDSSLGLILHAENVRDLASKRAVLRECVDDIIPDAKSRYLLIPQHKRADMLRIEADIYREFEGDWEKKSR